MQKDEEQRQSIERKVDDGGKRIGDPAYDPHYAELRCGAFTDDQFPVGDEWSGSRGRL